MSIGKLFKKSLTYVAVGGFVLSNSFAVTHVSPKFDADASKVKDFLGTSKAKMVFVDQFELFFIDFSKSPLEAVKLENVKPHAVAPMISPDGKWVVYGQGDKLKGDLDAGSLSSAYICKLEKDAKPILIKADSAHSPRFVYGTDQLDIVYATCMQWEAWKDNTGKTMRQNIDNDGNKVGDPEVIFDDFATYGGITYPDNDGKRYLATAIGGTGARLIKLNSAKDITVLHSLNMHKLGETSTVVKKMQCCNPSASSSKKYPSAMMYFDFGSPYGYVCDKVNNGLPWKQHGAFFISNFTGELFRSYVVPLNTLPLVSTKEASEKYGDLDNGGGVIVDAHWDNPEWSNNPNFATAAVETDRLWRVNGSWKHKNHHELVYLTNLKDSTYLKLMHDPDTTYDAETEFRWPWLWMDVSEDGAADGFNSVINKNPIQSATLAGNSHIVFDGRDLTSDSPISNIVVFTTLGREVKNLKINGRRTVDLSSYNGSMSGIYFIRVNTNVGSTVFRWLPGNKN